MDFFKLFYNRYYIENILRAWPPMIVTFMILLTLITTKVEYLLFLLVVIFSENFNSFIKQNVFKPLMKGKDIPILGTGTRPEGAINCAPFLSTKGDIKSKSYGMPSGHSQTAVLFAVYFILDILYGNLGEYKTKNEKMIGVTGLSIITFAVLFSRLKFGCHTLQQIIVGTIIGALIAGVYFFNKDVLIAYLQRSISSY